jgi:adenine-specific DNA-methyltransferase
MPIEKLKPSFFFDEEKIRELKQVVPEAFADGKINWNTFKEALGEHLEYDSRDAEHFGLFWPGKREARRLASIPSKGTLVPVKGEGINEDSTGNIFIEGENLEVLKILRKSYAGRVKMIYIDPPYNTGNDFVYDDNFTEPLEDYLRRTGQADEEGRALTTNKKSDGRFHSKWLSMMYPRLKLARELLRDDGVIFVSIDDNEVHNLRILMNEIFGEENQVGVLTWKNKYGAGAKTRTFIEVHEYILCYSKNYLTDIESELTKEQIEEYDNKDDKFNVRGGFVTQPLMTNSLGDRTNLQYKVKYKNDIIQPRKQWVWEEERLLKAINNDEVIFKKKKDGNYSVRAKVYLKDENGKLRKGKPISVLNGPFNQEGTKEVSELLGAGVFDFPKPKKLLKYLFDFKINNNDDNSGIYLDFFSGSCTSAHAILELNAEYKSDRKYIMIQIPETCDTNTNAYKAGYKTISEIAMERIRRVIKSIENELKEQKKKDKTKLPGMGESKDDFDLGFKVFKLTHSTFKPWENYHGEDIDVIEDLFSGQVTPLVDNWTEDDLFTEVMLLEGFPLDSVVKPCGEYKNNTVKEVSSSFSEHKLFISLDKKINQTTIKDLDLGENDIFVCLDSAVNDEAKARLSDKGLIKTI